ncbi:MAG: hypothetical protein AAF318_14775 [Pseudomonadota bacterium]
MLLRLLLIPHLIAIAAFLGSYTIVVTMETNRTTADLILGTAGYIFGTAAIVASLFAAAMVLSRPSVRPQAPWLIAHLALILVVIAQGTGWLATHLV